MGFTLTKQSQERLIRTVTSGAVDTTLAVTNRTNAHRKANLTSKQLFLNSFTNGAFVSVAGTTAAETGTVELWGYPEKGSAEWLGSFTYTLGTQTAEDGGVYADAFVLSVAAVHTVTILGAAFNNGKGSLKFDAVGFKYIVAQLTAVSANTHRVYFRPW